MSRPSRPPRASSRITAWIGGQHLPVLLLAASTCAQPPAPPSATTAPVTFETVYAASLEAMGGEVTLATIRSLRALADCVGPRGAYTTEIHSARGGRTRFRQVAEDGEFVGYVNDNVAWTVDPASGRVTALGRQQGAMFRGHEFQMMAFDLPARFTATAMEGEEPFAGRRCRRIAAVDELGLPARLYFDPATSLLAGFEITDPRGEDGGTVRVVIDAWRRTGEVLLPSRVTATDRSGDWVLDFHTVEIDTVDEEMFAVPPGL